MQNRRRESPLVIFIKAFPPQIVGIMVLQIALINGVLMIGAVFLGMALDKQFGTRPLLTLVLPVVCAILSVLIAYLLAMRTVKKSRKAYLNWKASTGQPVDESGPGKPETANRPAITFPDVH